MRQFREGLAHYLDVLRNEVNGFGSDFRQQDLLLLPQQARRREDLQLDLVLEGMSVSHCLLEACVRRYHVL